jgi:alpha-glucosidase
MDPGVTSRTVYLPHGNSSTALKWKHEFTGDVYEGGKRHIISAPVDSLPLFFKLKPESGVRTKQSQLVAQN